MLATLRAADLSAESRPGVKPIDGAGIMNAPGQALFNAPFPIGWPDQASD